GKWGGRGRRWRAPASDSPSAASSLNSMAGGSGSGVKWVRARRLPSRCRSRLEDRDSAREGDYSMTDLDRLGLALVGFALAVVVGGVLFGLIGAWIKKAREWTDEPSSRAQWRS